MKFSIVSAALPPQLDGIGDYTAFLSSVLSRQHEVQIVTASPNPNPIENVNVRSVFDATVPASVASIAAPIIENNPDWVLVQYNPFSYGKWGWNPYLVPALRKIRRSLPGVRIAVMAHESFVPIITVKFAVMASWQRFLFWRLGRNSDILFLSIDPWAKRFQKWFPNIPVMHLPVGANIPRMDIARGDAKQRLGYSGDDFVVGLFGVSHISRPMEWVGDAVRRLREKEPRTKLLYVGPSVDDIKAAIGDAAPIKADGSAPAEEVSRRFAAMDMYLCPYADGVSTRRGAFMAGLQHGIPAVSTRGIHTDDILLKHANEAYLLSPTERGAFIDEVEALFLDRDRRVRMALAARRFYDDTFDWPAISDEMCRAMAAVSDRNTAK